MHELSLMEEVRRLALEEVERHGGGRLLALTLRIGSLAGVDPEALRFAWEVVMEEPPTTAARLTIEKVEATAFCGPCGREFPCPDGLTLCPACGAISRDLHRGRELELASLELGEQEPGPRASGSAGIGKAVSAVQFPEESPEWVAPGEG
jgi:hydrogenase nickel incorporation protein HypA/HybF